MILTSNATQNLYAGTFYNLTVGTGTSTTAAVEAATFSVANNLFIQTGSTR